MTSTVGTSCGLALGMVLLAGCSTPTAIHHRTPPAPSLVTVTGSSNALPYMSMRVAPGWMAYAPVPYSVDKFPDKEANKSHLVADDPVSTFSVDVDTASYAFVRRLLSAGRIPPVEAVRVEEMVNYFPYKYAGPKSRSQPFAVTTEVMPSPWKAENQLVHVAVRGFDIKVAERPSANVVLLVDVSGSMDLPDRLTLLKQGFRCLPSNCAMRTG